MTTPGHQAGPTPADGDDGLAPGAGYPQAGGAPGPAAGHDAEDAYGPHEDHEDAYGPYENPGDAYGSHQNPGDAHRPYENPGDAYGRCDATPQDARRQHGPARHDASYGAPEDARRRPDARYGTPANGPIRAAAPDDAYGRYGAPGAGQGRHGAPESATARYDTPDDAYDSLYRPAAPDPARHASPQDVRGRYGAPGPDDGRYGQRAASVSPELPARTRPRRPGPGRAEPGWTEPGTQGGVGWIEPTAGAGDATWNPSNTRPFPAVEEEQAPGSRGAQAGQAAAPANASLMRSSGVMAVGTLASRLTGFVRNAVIIYAVGTLLLGDAYNLANTLPNIVYNLALGGILTSVVVPLLVNAAKREADHGEAYDQRIFTLGVLALGGVTLFATLLAEPITAVYAGNIGTPAAYHLTVIFAYFFIPQIFFYGVSSLAGAILNARGSFAAPMWTPVINNLVVILVGVAFMATAGLNRTPADISAGQVQMLGIGTTLGIVLQTVALIPSLRRVGFRWRPRRDFRRAEISEIGRMSGWMFGYVLTTQISFLVTTRIANLGGHGVSRNAVGAGFAAYSNAYTLFQLPYAIVGISVITALLPRMSAHAAERKYGLVSSDFSTAARLASVIVVPAALILAVLGPPLAEGVFGYGSTSVASAQYVGEIFAVFSLGLLPFTLFQLLLRVFYAMHDSKTPALISVITMVINIVANFIALAVLPPRHVVAGLGAGFGLASLAGTIAAWRVLGRRIGGLDGPAIRQGLVRMHAAAIPAAIFAIAVAVMVGAIFPGGRIGALLTVAIGGSGAMVLYVLFAKAFSIAELNEVTASVRARLR
jgi:putative peptidoglycan lipid II flippase